MSDEPDNLVLRHLRELRADMTQRFDGAEVKADVRFVKIEARLSDLTGVMHDTRADVHGLAGRLDKIETSLGLADRLAAVEEKLAALERRFGS
ncbi:MAG TPA: hypothetical protein VKO16_07095 [Polyangia bacterium]|jgi:hypothetical protein|nr:hypothetical protein [Polyangia bacterium]